VHISTSTYKTFNIIIRSEYCTHQFNKTRNSANAEIIKGNPKYMGASLAQNQDHFTSECGFIVGVGKPKLCTKFEVPRLSHCVNIKVEPQNFGELP